MIFTIIYLSVCAVARNVEFDSLIFIIVALIDVTTSFLGVISKELDK